MRLLGSTIPPADELEAAYRKSDSERRRYHNLFEFAGAACLVTDLGGRIREANQAAVGLLRVRGRCLIGADLIGLVAEEDRARFSAQLGTLGRLRRIVNWQVRLLLPGGLHLEAEAAVTAVQNAQTESAELHWTLRDVSGDGQAAGKIRELHAVLSTIRKITRLITREAGRDALLQCVCDELVESHGYYSAWTAVFDEAGRAVGSWGAGVDEAFRSVLEQLERDELPHCVTMVLRRREMVVIGDVCAECGMCGLASPESGRVALSALLEHGGKVYGVMTVSAAPEVLEDVEEQQLLSEMVADIGFALHEMMLKEQRERAEQALEESERALAIRNQIAHIFLTVSDEGMYGEVLKVILNVADSSDGVFGYIDEDGSLVVSSMTPNIWSRCAVGDKTLVFGRESWGGSVWARAVREKKTIHSNEAPTNLPEGHIGIRRHICSPIIDREQVVGLIHVANRATDYDASDIQLMESIAAHIAPILSARLQRDRQESGRKRAEEETTRLGGFMGENPNPAFRVTREGAVLYANDASQAVLRLLGCGAQRRLAQEWREVAGEVLRSGRKADRVVELDDRSVSLTFTPAAGADCVNVYGLDITELRRAQQERREHEFKMARVSRLTTMGEMASAIAHELNQPLTAITLTSDACRRLARSGSLDMRELAQAMEEVAGQADRAGRVIRSLREFVRKRKQSKTTVLINDIVEDSTSLIQTEASFSGVVMKLELADGLPPVLVDSIQIEQVILNLARNGIEAMADVAGDDRQLTIRTAMVGNDEVEIVVTDRGCGLPHDDLDQLLDPFFTSKSDGMGLGLSISRSITEAHGGRLEATSSPSGGATFRVILPIEAGGDGDDGGADGFRSG